MNSGYITKELLKCAIDIEKAMCRATSDVKYDLDGGKMKILHAMYDTMNEHYPDMLERIKQLCKNYHRQLMEL